MQKENMDREILRETVAEIFEVINRRLTKQEFRREDVTSIMLTLLVNITKQHYCEDHAADGWNDIIYRIWASGAPAVGLIDENDVDCVIVAACINSMAKAGVIMHELSDGDSRDAIITGYAQTIWDMQNGMPGFDLGEFLADTRTAVECTDDEDPSAEEIEPSNPETKSETVH